MDSIFKVDGRTFFPFGGQSRNSSAYNKAETKRFWDALEVLGGNTAEIPIYWDAIEPVEDEFDFTIIDNLVIDARERGFKLILLWFATWKNGMMKYAPVWVKQDRKRFKRVISHDGAEVSVLSSHCRNNLEADKKAFCKVIEHIKKLDEKEKTVIGIQVENEPGILAKAYRDHGRVAEEKFNAQVPEIIVEKMIIKASGNPYKMWIANGAKEKGNWVELFGENAQELFSAFGVASYIDEIAYAGKQIYYLPMLVNVWLDKQGWEVPGVDYPSGAPEENTLDIWKWITKGIDIIAPDIYKANTKIYCRHCSFYNRDDNALFIPESSSWDVPNSYNMFYAIATYGATGYFVFGLENILLDDNKTINPSSKSVIGSFKAIRSALPLIINYRGSKNMVPIVQEENMIEQQLLDFDKYTGLVLFNTDGFEDYHHSNQKSSDERGRGIIIQDREDENTFYAFGAGCVIFLREKRPDIPYSENKRESLVNYISVQEGHFGEDEEYICDRIRTGDETDYGIWIYPDVGVVKIVMGK